MSHQAQEAEDIGARAPSAELTAKGRPAPPFPALQVRTVVLFHSHFIRRGGRWLFLGVLWGMKLLWTPSPT